MPYFDKNFTADFFTSYNRGVDNGLAYPGNKRRSWRGHTYCLVQGLELLAAQTLDLSFAFTLSGGNRRGNRRGAEYIVRNPEA